ncbi:MAG: DNA repair protein RecN [Allosphingosinicella sp.]
MLTGISIRDVVLIDTLDLEFGPGLGVLTGETGAGKSILLDALGLALGARADSALVRSGRPQASVSVTFDLDEDHGGQALLRDNGLAGEPGEPLVIRRVVRADGGSRAFVNDQPTSAGLLRELGALLVEIHGQHDDRGLLNPRGHRALLDASSGIDVQPIAAAWQALSQKEEQLAKARAAVSEGQRDRDWLEHAVAELERLDPQPGEEEQLAGTRSAMQAGARLGEELTLVAGLIQGSDGGLSQLRQAARRLDRIAREHELLGATLAALDRAVIEASEAEDMLERARLAMSFDPARLEEAETRLFEIRALARKHQVAPEQLAELRDELAGRLALLDSGEEGLAELEAAVIAARASFDEAAASLTAKRRLAATRLDQAVTAELAPLKLEQAGFRTAIAASEPGPSGKDRVEFEVSTNPGAPFGPLVRIASGGELSRFVLALKVALHEQGEARTIVFDEIDRGVGGAVASAVGERLHRLAQSGQVLVVTHSPQVAARGARHLLIEKSHDGTVTRTSVHALDEERRREEIARMLSGAQVTDEARAQASRLLEAA